MNNPMTFCIGTCNNLNYLKLAIHSVRKYSHFKDAPFIIFAENCTDGTDEWLKEHYIEYNLKIYIEHNDEEHTKGIGGGMNFCVDRVKTEYIMFLHADMFVSKNWDLECLKIFDKYPNVPMWVNPERFQPNLFKEDSRPGTVVFNYNETDPFKPNLFEDDECFGYKHDNFNEQYFIEYAEEFSKMNTDREFEKGEGVSGLIRKKDWDYLGGNDPRFAPAYWEDTDIFIRSQLANYKFVITCNSVVFHFGSRSDKSNFPNDEIIRSERSKMYEQRGAKRFFEKWGFWPAHTEQQFVTYPPNIDKSKYQHLIRLNENTSSNPTS
jgi:GT2 family glycosyltransferase